MTKKWKAPMGGSVLSFLKAEWKVSDTGSVGLIKWLIMLISTCIIVEMSIHCSGYYVEIWLTHSL